MLAIGQDPDTALPACCRRHGQHHCTMLESDRDSSAHRFVAVCPAWPQRAVPSQAGSQHFIERTSSPTISLRAGFSAPPQPHDRRPAPRERLHPKRGPPNRLLA
jgi:hypothetical protein